VVAEAMSEDVAAVMMTNPNTLGVFERNVAEIARIVHAKGGLLYGDGANLNALLGRARPGDMGVDVMQFNLHKTSPPAWRWGPWLGAGGGREGSGPVPASAGSDQEWRWLSPGVRSPPDHRPAAHLLGQLRGDGPRLRLHPRAGAGWAQDDQRPSRCSTPNYVRALLKDDYHLPYATPSLHEVVFTTRARRTWA